MDDRLIFCNTAWMKDYRGLRGDTPVGGGSYVKKHGTGSEILNFKPAGRKMRGFVMVKGSINLQRLGAAVDAEGLDHVTAVWVAPSPTSGLVIVGWYRNATVMKYMEQDGQRSRDYNITALVRNCRLLPIDQRTFRIPRGGPGAMGQSNVWYADGQSETFRKSVLEYIKSGGRMLPAGSKRRIGRKGGRGPNRSWDPVRQAQIEKAAVRAAAKHYEAIGYAVATVEEDNVGWDLEACTEGGSYLRVEVKGLSGKDITVELTPNC